MELRRGTAADTDAVADLYLLARRRAVPRIPPPARSDDEIRAHWRGVMRKREVWVADDGRILGLMVLGDDWVIQLYVDPDLTGQGIGSGLLDLAKRERPQGLQLWTFAANAGARRFYERHGFVAVEETDGSGNEERTPDVRYTWHP